MAELTPLDEKLGEVLGLAQAAQVATQKVRTLEGAEAFQDDLDRMREQASETERRTDQLIDAREGRKTAIREKASDTNLRQGLEMHRAETEGHIKRLEQVFRQHGAEVKAANCPAIDGILEEADEVAGDVADKQVLDAAIIAAAQAVEHYEITRYGTLTAWAKQLGRPDCAELLQQNLDEEYAADDKLTKLAESGINRQAA